MILLRRHYTIDNLGRVLDLLGSIWLLRLLGPLLLWWERTTIWRWSSRAFPTDKTIALRYRNRGVLMLELLLRVTLLLLWRPLLRLLLRSLLRLLRLLLRLRLRSLLALLLLEIRGFIARPEH